MSRVIDDELRQIIRNEHKSKVEDESFSLLGKWFKEADDNDEDYNEEDSMEKIENDMNNIDSNESEDEESDEDDNNDSDDSDDSFGSDDSDIQNDYDEDELNELNKLIADEQEAIKGYFDAAKKSKNDVLVRLYSDIGDEERFHTEQLLYAKAELTGEKYEPSDPEVKKEYEELLEGGMDEETAMYTVADKHRISYEEEEVTTEDLEDMEKEMDNLNECFIQTVSNCELLLALQESAAYKSHAELRNAYAEFAENVMFMEAVDNVSTKQGSEILGTNNPFVIIGRMIKSVYTFIINTIKKIKNWINKRRIKNKRTLAWIKKHGIKGLFQNGVKLYFYNDQNGSVEVSDAVAFMQLCMNVTDWVAKAVGIRSPRVNNGKASGTAFSKNAKTIPFTSINDGMHKIEGVVFSKSKIIVNDQNQSDIEAMFFGISGGAFMTSNDEGQTYDFKSKNIHNALQYILEWSGEQLRVTEEWMNNAMIPAAGKQRGIVYTKPEVYKDCVAAMKAVTKGYSKLAKCLSADISTCMKLDQGLLNAVNQIDEGRSPNDTRVNIPNDSGARDSNGNIRKAEELH